MKSILFKNMQNIIEISIEKYIIKNRKEKYNNNVINIYYKPQKLQGMNCKQIEICKFLQNKINLRKAK